MWTTRHFLYSSHQERIDRILCLPFTHLSTRWYFVDVAVIPKDGTALEVGIEMPTSADRTSGQSLDGSGTPMGSIALRREFFPGAAVPRWFLRAYAESSARAATLLAQFTSDGAPLDWTCVISEVARTHERSPQMVKHGSQVCCGTSAGYREWSMGDAPRRLNHRQSSELCSLRVCTHPACSTSRTMGLHS